MVAIGVEDLRQRFAVAVQVLRDLGETVSYHDRVPLILRRAACAAGATGRLDDPDRTFEKSGRLFQP